MNTKTISRQATKRTYPLTTYRGRGLIWEKLRGMWKNRKQNLAKELKRARGEWK